jgi:hypothetical protein
VNINTKAQKDKSMAEKEELPHWMKISGIPRYGLQIEMQQKESEASATGLGPLGGDDRELDQPPRESEQTKPEEQQIKDVNLVCI